MAQELGGEGGKADYGADGGRAGHWRVRGEPVERGPFWSEAATLERYEGRPLQSTVGEGQIILSDWLSTQAVVVINKFSVFNVFVIYKMLCLPHVK